MKKNNIHGLMMRPCSSNQEDNEAVIQSSDYSVSTDFLKEYRNHKIAMQIVSECAKIYVLNNWEKVTDWSDLEVIMEDANTLEGHLNDHNGGKPLEDYVEYYNYTGKRLEKKNRLTKSSDFMKEWLGEMDDKDKLRHNPVISVSDVVLDTSDGDFSLKINGRSHMWISDSTVIIIADYIEKELNNGE